MADGMREAIWVGPTVSRFGGHRRGAWRTVGMLLMCVMGILSTALAQEAAKGLTFTDLRGQKHEGVKVLRVEGDALVIMTSSGILKLPASVLPNEIRQQYGVMESAATAPEMTSGERGQKPAREETADPVAPPAAAAPAESQATTPALTIDEIELSKLRAEMEKLGAEIKNLETTRTQVKDEYNREYMEAKQRFKAQYDIDMQVYEKRARTRKKPGEPPQIQDPDSDLDVSRLKARIQNLEEQVKERRKWFQDIQSRERVVADRVASVRRLEADKAAKAKYEQMRQDEEKRIQQMYTDRRRAVEEREAMERREEEEKIEAEKGRLKSLAEDCKAIGSMARTSDVRETFLRLQALYADRDRWDTPGSEAAKQVGELALDLFDVARMKGELAVATSCMRLALNLDEKSPKLSETLIRFFDEAAGFIREGDFQALEAHMEYIQDVGLDGNNLVVRKRHELSNVALDRGWEALKQVEFGTAGSAVEAARRLWDRNPRLGWFRTTVNGSFFVGIILGLLVIFKGVEKLYWWLNRG